jgi:hypothetical protein
MSNPFAGILVQHTRMSEDSVRNSRPSTPEPEEKQPLGTQRAGSVLAETGDKGSTAVVQTEEVGHDEDKKQAGSVLMAPATPSKDSEPATPMPLAPTQREVPPAPPPKPVPPPIQHSLQTPAQRADISEFDPFSPVPPTPSPAAVTKPDEPETPVAAATNAATGAIQAISNVFRRQPVASSSTPSHSRNASQAGSVRSGGDADEPVAAKDKEPSFDFQGFLAQLKLRSAEPVARYLKR